MPGAQTAEAKEFRRELYFSIAPASNIERSGDVCHRKAKELGLKKDG